MYDVIYLSLCPLYWFCMWIQDLTVCLSWRTTLMTLLLCGPLVAHSSKLWASCMSCPWRTAPPSTAAVCQSQSYASSGWKKGKLMFSMCGKNVTTSWSLNIHICFSWQPIHLKSSMWGLVDLLTTWVGLTYLYFNSLWCKPLPLHPFPGVFRTRVRLRQHGSHSGCTLETAWGSRQRHIRS